MKPVESGVLTGTIITRGDDQYVVLPEGISLGAEVEVTRVGGQLFFKPLGPIDVDPNSLPRIPVEDEG